MVNAVVAPIFRYFDILDRASTDRLFDGLERVTNWRLALAQRPSVRAAFAEDCSACFFNNLRDHQALLLETA